MIVVSIFTIRYRTEYDCLFTHFIQIVFSETSLHIKVGEDLRGEGANFAYIDPLSS